VEKKHEIVTVCCVSTVNLEIIADAIKKRECYVW